MPAVALSVSKCRWIRVVLVYQKRCMLFSVNVPVHSKLARCCDNFGNNCSFFWQRASAAWILFSRSFLPTSSQSWICVLCCLCTGSLVPWQGQLDKQASLVGLNHGHRHRWSGRGMHCAVIARGLAWSLRLFLELIEEHPRTQHICLAKMYRRMHFPTNIRNPQGQFARKPVVRHTIKNKP